MNIMEITTMLGTLLGVLTPLGGVGVWVYRKQNKRLKESEARLAEINVDKGRIEAKKQEVDRLLAQIDHQQETIDKLMERNDTLVKHYAEREDKYQEELNEKTTLIRKLNADQVASLEREKQHIRHAAKLAKELEHYKLWRCYREHTSLDSCNGCDRRLPEQSIPIKYIPIDDLCEDCEVVDCTARTGITQRTQRAEGAEE